MTQYLFLNNLVLFGLSSLIFLVYLAISARFTKSPLDRLLAATTFSLSHYVGVCFFLAFLIHAANPTTVFFTGLTSILVTAGLWRITPSLLLLSTEETFRDLCCRLQNLCRGFLPASILVAVLVLLLNTGINWQTSRGTIGGFAIIAPQLHAGGIIANTALFVLALCICIVVAQRRSNAFTLHKTDGHVTYGALKNLWQECDSFLLCVPFVIFLGLITVKVVSGYLLKPYTCDALAYHLPIAVNILKHGQYIDITGGMLKSMAWHEYMNGYPKNLSLLYFWVLSLARSDLLITFVSLLFGPVSVAAVYRMCRSLGCSARTSFFVSPLALFNYFSMIQMNTCMGDHTIATLLLLAFMLALRKFRLFNTIQLSLVCGLVCGSFRFSVVPVCAVAWWLYFGRQLWVIRVSARSTQALRQILKNSALSLMLIACLGLYQYVRNTITYHNPIYPYSFGFMHKQNSIQISAKNMATKNARFYNSEKTLGRLVESISTVWGNFSHSSRRGGWGLLFLYVMLPAHVLGIVIRRRDYGYLTFACLSWAVFFITPMFYWLRYTLVFFFLSIVPVGVCLERQIKGKTVSLFIIGVIAVTVVTHGALQVGYRKDISTNWKDYLKLTNRYDKAAFLNPKPHMNAIRAIHTQNLGTDVVYTDSAQKYYFYNMNFDNNVVALDYQSDSELLRQIKSLRLVDPAIVVKLKTVRDAILSESKMFRCVYRNRSCAIFKLVQ